MAAVQNIKMGKNLRLYTSTAGNPELNDDRYQGRIKNDTSLEWSVKVDTETAETKESDNVITTPGSKSFSIKLTASTVYDDFNLNHLRKAALLGYPVPCQIRDITKVKETGLETDGLVILEGEFLVTEETGKADIKGVNEVTLTLEAASGVKTWPEGRAYLPDAGGAPTP